MADTQRFRACFWGVRGSYPTPGKHTTRYGGNTACVEVQVGAHTLILDAGSGIIRLGNNLLQRRRDEALHISLLITHGHGDHLIGFPFFAPLFDPRASIDIFGPQLTGQSIEQLVTTLMSPPYFPVDVRMLPSHRKFHTLVDGERVTWYANNPDPRVTTKQQARNDDDAEVQVTNMMTNSHPKDGAFIYRIEYGGRSLVFATDVEWGDEDDPAFLAFAKETDLLIHDAQYTTDDYQDAKQGFGHSTVQMAAETALAVGARQLVLFHHEPTYDDNKLDSMEAEARRYFPNTCMAYEGMEIDL